MQSYKKRSALFLALSIGWVAAAGAEKYSLEKYLSLVEENNVTVLLSEKDLASSKQTERQAFSVLLPTVAAAGGYTRNLNDVKESTPVAAVSQVYNGVYPLIYQNVDSNYDNELSLALSATWNLIDPAALAQYEKAKKGTAIQRSETEYTRQQVLTGAEKLYAQTQLLESVAEVKKNVAATSEAVYHDMEKKYNAGTATEVNLRMAEVDWKSDLSSVSEAEKNIRVSMMALKNLAGLPLDASVELTDSSAELPPLPEKADLGEVLGSRLDYQAALLSKEISAITYRASMASFLPTVSSSFTYAYGQYGGYAGKNDWDAYDYNLASVGLKVTVPLFTGGARLAAIKQAKIMQDASDLQLKEKRDSIEQDLVSIELQLDEAWQQIDSARTLEDATSRALAITRTAFANGMDTQIELSKAMSQYANAQVNLQNAIFNYRAAYYDYQCACGKIGV
jgi:outer membrane protein TolC